MRSRLLFVLVISLLAAGCGMPKGCREDRSSGIAAADLPGPTYGQASVGGLVRFEGNAPRMPVIEAAKHCGNITEEWAVVGEGGELANVLVYLVNAPQSSGNDREAILLDQVSCRFVPHVLGVQIGQPLVAKNSMRRAAQAASSASLPPRTSGERAGRPSDGPSSRVSQADEAVG